MDNIWKNTMKKQRARDLRDTTVTSTLTTPVLTTLPVTTTTTPKWCDPETVTLEQIDENTRRLLWEWPKDNGTPFPMEILEVLRDLKLRVRARDAKKTHAATVSVATSTDTASVICTPAPVYLVIDTSKPNTFISDPQDSISITMNHQSMYPHYDVTGYTYPAHCNVDSNSKPWEL